MISSCLFRNAIYVTIPMTNFESHAGSLCRKVGQKIDALASLKNYLTSDLKKMTTWFCHKVSVYLLPSDMDVYVTYLNNALNNIRERVLRLIYNYHKKSFNSILTENNLKTIHQKTLAFLAIEIYQFQNGLSPPILNDILF